MKKKKNKRWMPRKPLLPPNKIFKSKKDYDRKREKKVKDLYEFYQARNGSCGSFIWFESEEK